MNAMIVGPLVVHFVVVTDLCIKLVGCFDMPQFDPTFLLILKTLPNHHKPSFTPSSIFVGVAPFETLL